MSKSVTKTFTVTASSGALMRRFERLLALLHFNSGFGHSGTFGMPLDGDGSDKIQIEELKAKYRKGSLPHEVELIGGVGYDIELAYTDGYGGAFEDRDRERRWRVGPAANLYKNGEVIKTSPSRDWDHEPREEPRKQLEATEDSQGELPVPDSGSGDRPGGCRKA